MRSIMTMLLAIGLLTTAVAAAGAGPEIQVIDGRIGVQAMATPLKQLLRLVDSAMGTTGSMVKLGIGGAPQADLENQSMNVRFFDLDVDSAIRKIFEGTAMEYMYIAGEGIIVTKKSGAVTSGGAVAPVPAAQPAPLLNPAQSVELLNPPAGSPTATPSPVSPQPVSPPPPTPPAQAPVDLNNTFSQAPLGPAIFK